MLLPESPAPESSSGHIKTKATGRNLVICCDGTSNEFGQKKTNVVRLLQVLQRDSDGQLVYYDPGVGTLPDPNRFTRIGKTWSKLAGLAFGAGLTKDVMEAYTYLMEQWEEGDRVYIFGFSRGAYTARVLAGLLHNFGLMPRGAHNLLPYIIRNYRALSDRDDDTVKVKEKEQLYGEFRRTFARGVKGGDPVERHFPVHFLGLWDTVASVGWVWQPMSFRHTAFNPSVQFTRHAIALDEKRFFFRQNRLARRRDEEESCKDETATEHLGVTDCGKRIPRVLEAWFPGSHCDVGGGYSEEEDKLWALSFSWILREAKEAGLHVDETRESRLPRDLDTVALDRQNESLKGAWKLAEYFPAVRWREVEKKVWKRRFEIGRATPRRLRKGELIHRSILLRLRAEAASLADGSSGPYVPRSLCTKFQEDVRKRSDVPEFLAYEPHGCGCEACERERNQ